MKGFNAVHAFETIILDRYNISRHDNTCIFINYCKSMSEVFILRLLLQLAYHGWYGLLVDVNTPKSMYRATKYKRELLHCHGFFKPLGDRILRWA